MRAAPGSKSCIVYEDIDLDAFFLSHSVEMLPCPRLCKIEDNIGDRYFVGGFEIEFDFFEFIP